jgi:gamma-glutamyltranspeptidase/glutathione hydrolase
LRNLVSLVAVPLFVLAFSLADYIVLQAHYYFYNYRNPLTDRGTYSRSAMVVSAHSLASEVGRTVMASGGNAFDAAVAVNFALAVVYPQAGNIGGGGFMVYRLTSGETGTLDFRETAPAAASATMYLDDDGNVEAGKSLEGVLAVGVPGTVAGMVELHQRFGTIAWPELLTPAIRLAFNGFPLTEKGAAMLNRYRDSFAKLNRGETAFVGASPWRAGDILKQPDLAAALRRIMTSGREGFYDGQTAELLVDEMQSAGGLITREDLATYRPKWRDPIRFSYRGHDIITMPPPSSGGVALAQLLTATEAFPIHSYGHNTDNYIHFLVEMERRVYADRAVYLGDTDFVDVPLNRLMSRDYIGQRMADIKPLVKTDSSLVGAGQVSVIESVETTHFSIVDPAGNAVSLTTTLNGNFGSKVVVQGAGFFLNNEMDDFAIKKGRPNQFGLIGGQANAIAPGKRMLSSMTPTIVEKDGQLKLVLGTPGGSTIITSVYQTLLNVIEFGMTAQQAVNARKFHSQWQPDIVLFEKGTPDVFDIIGLRARDHKLVMWPGFSYELGRVEAIMVHDDGRLEGAADFTRGIDDRAAGF